MNGILLNQNQISNLYNDNNGNVVIDAKLVVNSISEIKEDSAIIAGDNCFTGDSLRSTIIAGDDCEIIDGSDCLCSGLNNILDGAADSVILGGENNINKNGNSIILGGQWLQTSANNQVIMGKYNNPNVSDIVQIGGGTSDQNRKNIFTIDNSGTVTVDKTKMTKSGFYLQVGPQNVAGMELKGNTGEIFGNFKGNFIGPALEQISAPLTKTEYTFTGDENGEETVISAFEIDGAFHYEISSTEMISSPTITLRISNGYSINITDMTELQNEIRAQLCKSSADYGVSESFEDQDFYIDDDFSIKKCSYDTELPNSLGVFQLNAIRQAVENYNPESSVCIINIEFIEIPNDDLQNTNSIIGAPIFVANGYSYTDTILNYIKRIIKTLSLQGINLEELE